MKTEFLMRFLEIGTIDLKSDDSKLEKLRLSAKDLSSVLQKAPAQTARFTMVAADPSIAATDPTIEEAMTALRKHWQTVANAFSARPVGILRAILLDALVQAARADDAIAVAFVNTARNALAHTETSAETEIWREAVGEIETKVDARAESEWATPETIAVQDFRFTPPAAPVVKRTAVQMDQEDLMAKIHSAAGPWGPEDPNPHQAHNNPSAWSKVFAEKLSVAIAEGVDSVVETLAPAPVDLSGPLSSLAKAVAVHVENALASFSGATAGLQRRTNLLWWKEALYSPSAHASYLDLPVFEASALMALDLHEQVPTYSPASVSAFLKEAIRSLPSEKSAKECGARDVGALVREARITASMQPFRALAAQYAPAPVGRGPLLAMIGHPLNQGALEGTSFRALGGVDESTQMTPWVWGAHLFRELQTARATNSGAVKRPKKK